MQLLNSYESIILEVCKCSIDVANSVTLLGKTNDSKLKLNQYVLQICRKVIFLPVSIARRKASISVSVVIECSDSYSGGLVCW